ncbi:MAG TPA: Asp-tRNA(Asn)/Glu-tRNA(Gln) amidotransferase subunit GatC [Thermoanaerobaculia bacterium]|nr:Asp-tRNA(Asn)/Glu-tRNA(Gln) amidotransferase subunit GatC [Thermoanaerobaculia bacterium]
MRIGSEEVRRVAALAGLEFDQAGVEQMAAELSRVLEYVDQLQELDVSGIVDDLGEDPVATPLRTDEVTQPISREDVAANAPGWTNGFFVVPQVIGNE